MFPEAFMSNLSRYHANCSACEELHSAFPTVAWMIKFLERRMEKADCLALLSGKFVILTSGGMQDLSVKEKGMLKNSEIFNVALQGYGQFIL